MKHPKPNLSFFFFLFLFFSCKPDTVLKKINKKCIINFECTKYCFPDGYCTNFLCLGLGDPDCVGDSEIKKSKKTQHIKRINLSKVNNTEVVKQFLLALDLYEKFEHDKEDRFHISDRNNYFFAIDNDKVYKGTTDKYPNSEFIIKNLGALSNFDIKNKVEVKKKEDPKGFWIYVKNTDFSCRLDSSFYYDHASIFN